MPPNPTIIAFDTSAAHCAAALLSGGKITTRVDEMSKGQAEHLMPMLEEMLHEAGIAWRDLDAIGVVTGPGNFTGIRIAVSAARGLALGLNKPAIGVDGFAARAFGLSRPVTVTIPAPRGQAYVQTFDAQGHPTQPQIVAQDDVIASSRPEQIVAAIAKIAASRLDQDNPRPAPLYIRSADAAPPRDAPPTIIA